jgi:PhnB protein
MSANYKPEEYHSVTPYLVVQDVPRLIDFLTQAFDAEELLRMPREDGTIMHAEVRVDDSIIMMGQPEDKSNTMPTVLYVYVEDVDATYQRAMQVDGVSLQDPADQFYGDRTAAVKDPCGNHWYIATHIEDVPMSS